MRVAALLLLIACEKSGSVETTSSSAAPAAPPVAVEHSATTPKPATVTPDAAVVTTAPDAPQDLEDEARAIADKLTVVGSDEGVMNDRRPGADLAKQIQDVRDAGKDITNGSAARGTRTGPADRVGADAVDSPVDTKPGSPPGRVSISSKTAYDESTLTADVVVAKIQAAYMAGIKRCYKRYLEKDASARGKVTLTITVNESGRSVSPKVAGFASQVDECLAPMLARWLFPKPLDRDGEATRAAFGITLQMVPD